MGAPQISFASEQKCCVARSVGLLVLKTMSGMTEFAWPIRAPIHKLCFNLPITDIVHSHNPGPKTFLRQNVLTPNSRPNFNTPTQLPFCEIAKFLKPNNANLQIFWLLQYSQNPSRSGGLPRSGYSVPGNEGPANRLNWNSKN
eukprot:jgi/Botrbrau1/16399/Bobra.0387s0009.1